MVCIKLLLLILFCLLSSEKVSAQPIYQIPWAQQQPKFVLPLYFEEGTGQKDTLYLGYDPNANVWSYALADSLFGVKPIHIDTNQFYVMWNASASHCLGGALCTEVFKANVCRYNFPYAIPSDISVLCINGMMPLKISWDISTLYSDSLPFPDLSPAPRARLRIVYGMPMCHARENFVTVTDQGGFVWASDTIGIVKDSITFFAFNGQPLPTHIGSLGFQIEPWDSPTNISYNNLDRDFKILVKNNRFEMRNLIPNSTIIISDLNGRTIVKTEIFNSKSYISPYIKNGLYVVSIIDTKVNTYKVLIN